MTLNDFLAYKEFCPCCNSKLNFHCMSKSNHNIKYINNKLNVEIPIVNYSLSPTKKTSFTIHLVLYMDCNYFEVDFLNAISRSLEAVSLERIDAFKTYTTSINPVSLYKDCGICKNYKYSTDIFFDFTTGKVISYRVDHEYIFCTKVSDLGTKKYALYNNFFVDKSTLIIAVEGHTDQQISTSIIPITEPAVLLGQFDMLSVFS